MAERFLNMKVTEQKVREWLETVKRLSSNGNTKVKDLNLALNYAFYKATEENEKEILIFIQRLLREVASGTMKLDFNIYALYTSLFESSSQGR